MFNLKPLQVEWRVYHNPIHFSPMAMANTQSEESGCSFANAKFSHVLGMQCLPQFICVCVCACEREREGNQTWRQGSCNFLYVQPALNTKPPHPEILEATTSAQHTQPCCIAQISLKTSTSCTCQHLICRLQLQVKLMTMIQRLPGDIHAQVVNWMEYFKLISLTLPASTGPSKHQHPQRMDC